MKNNNTRSKNEAFPHDVDHMNGTRGIGLSAYDSRDLLKKSNSSYGNKRQWDQDVARVNAELLDDQAEFTTDANGFVQVLINGVAFARWSRRNGNGDINIQVARTQSVKTGMNESVSILSEALKEISIAPDRVTNYNPLFAPNRAMASNKSGKYCLTRDKPPVRGKGFMCFGSEKDAIAAWKRLSNNVGVKIVRESAYRDDGTPLKEGEVLLVDTTTLSEAVGDSYADRLAIQLPPGLMDENDVLDQAFEIAQSEVGAKRARYMFTYDEDFASDLVSAYFANERAGGMQEAAGDVKSPVPRNFVAKNAKMGGAGQHTDKKRASKQGTLKHKGKLDEQALVEADLTELSKTTRDRYVNRAVSAHGGYHMARRNTQGKDQEYWERKEQNTKKGISRALSDERRVSDSTVVEYGDNHAYGGAGTGRSSGATETATITRKAKAAAAKAGKVFSTSAEYRRWYVKQQQSTK